MKLLLLSQVFVYDLGIQPNHLEIGPPPRRIAVKRLFAKAHLEPLLAARRGDFSDRVPAHVRFGKYDPDLMLAKKLDRAPDIGRVELPIGSESFGRGEPP